MKYMGLTSLSYFYGFLPLVVVVTYLTSLLSRRLCVAFVILASLTFAVLSGGIASLPVLAFSLALNYALGNMMVKKNMNGERHSATILLSIGIILDICILVFFKYLTIPATSPIALAVPLGLSYFTFSKIIYLVELFRGEIQPPGIGNYSLYILFFPKLVAGPITKASEFLGQLTTKLGTATGEQLLKGLSFFSIGLFKKSVIADQLAPFVSPVFDAAMTTGHLGFYQAWFGAVAYGLQLYFDFSGYTDMAIGSALLLGISLPVNFDAPYRATSISEFWRIWHMTLGSFFKENVYIPLGGNRKGVLRKLLNLFIVMLLVGIWHGAGLTFLLWGAIHGVYLVIHNLWLSLKSFVFGNEGKSSLVGKALGWMLTFAAVTVAWVPFRATDLPSARRLLVAMGSFVVRMPSSQELALASMTVLPAFLIVLCLPTTQRWLSYESPSQLPAEVPSEERHLWKPGLLNGLVIGTMAVSAIVLLTQASEFIYKGF